MVIKKEDDLIEGGGVRIKKNQSSKSTRRIQEVLGKPTGQ